jgi:membrane protease YdiL (CAAX protease family)
MGAGVRLFLAGLLWLAANLLGLLAFVVYVGADVDPETLDGLETFVVTLPSQIGLILGAMVLARISSDRPAQWIGLESGPATEGVAAFLIGVACQFALVPLYLLLEPLVGDDVGDVAGDLSERFTGGERVLFVVMVLVAAPIAEEFFFRGAVQGILGEWFGPVVGVVGTAVLFAAVHLVWVVMPGLFAFGLVLGYLRLRTGRLQPSILCHAGFNAVTVLSLWAGWGL